MKLTINGVEQKESEFKGETLEAILDTMVKNTPGSYIRRIWLDQQEFPSDDRETLQKKPVDINALRKYLANKFSFRGLVPYHADGGIGMKVSYEIV